MIKVMIDFGIAKSGDKTSTSTNQTFVGATLDYSPIEQILRVINATFREFIILKHRKSASITPLFVSIPFSARN